MIRLSVVNRLGDPSCRRAEREPELEQAIAERSGEWHSCRGTEAGESVDGDDGAVPVSVVEARHPLDDLVVELDVGHKAQYRKNAIIAQLRCSLFQRVLRLLDTTVSCWACRSLTMPATRHAGRRHRFRTPTVLEHSYTYAPQVLHAFGNGLGSMMPHISERASERIRAELGGSVALAAVAGMCGTLRPEWHLGSLVGDGDVGPAPTTPHAPMRC